MIWRGITLVWIRRVIGSRAILIRFVAAGLRAVGFIASGGGVVGIAPIVEAEIVEIGIEQIRVAGPIRIGVDIPVLELATARVESIAVVIAIGAARQAGGSSGVI